MTKAAAARAAAKKGRFFGERMSQRKHLFGASGSCLQAPVEARPAGVRTGNAGVSSAQTADAATQRQRVAAADETSAFAVLRPRREQCQ
jgi:hypothetical protein